MKPKVIWSDAGQDPEADMKAQVEWAKQQYGIRPNFLTPQEEIEFHRRVQKANEAHQDGHGHPNEPQ